jgi:4a-hydroxytetrahydrobiopterin dehydratase
MKLQPAEIPSHMLQTPQWSIENERLTRVFLFKSYSAGVAFAMRVAMLSEKLDHHPDSLDIGWKKVRVAYLTHDVAGLTAKDFLTAQKVDALFTTSA